jgi:hypothetical protein
MGAWRDIIKPALLELRTRYKPVLKDNYLSANGDLFCKCDTQIRRAGITLAIYREAEFDTSDNGKHMTAVCSSCFDLLKDDIQLRQDYYLLDLVQWSLENDSIDPGDVRTKEKVQDFLERAARRGII